MHLDDDLDAGAQPSCPTCGTVMREGDGGYECGWDGTRIEVPWVERPRSGDALPGIRD